MRFLAGQQRLMFAKLFREEEGLLHQLRVHYVMTATVQRQYAGRLPAPRKAHVLPKHVLYKHGVTMSAPVPAHHIVGILQRAPAVRHKHLPAEALPIIEKVITKATAEITLIVMAPYIVGATRRIILLYPLPK